MSLSDRARRARIRHHKPLLNERIVFLVRRSTTRSPLDFPPGRPAPAPRAEDTDRTARSTSNCPRWSIYSGLAIYDPIRFISPEIQTICFRIAWSLGSLLRAAAPRASRFARPNSRILIPSHRPGFEGRRPTSRSTPRRSSTSAPDRRSIPPHRQTIEQVESRHGARPLLQGRRGG